MFWSTVWFVVPGVLAMLATDAIMDRHARKRRPPATEHPYAHEKVRSHE